MASHVLAFIRSSREQPATTVAAEGVDLPGFSLATHRRSFQYAGPRPLAAGRSRWGLRCSSKALRDLKSALDCILVCRQSHLGEITR